MAQMDTESIGGDETILLVEDEAALREVTAFTLQSAGYTVVEADSPAKAIQIVATHREGSCSSARILRLGQRDRIECLYHAPCWLPRRLFVAS
jgi:CheY-like chemotaxis protein